jgi:hypothetical protein
MAQGLNKTLRYVDMHIPPKKEAKFFSKRIKYVIKRWLSPQIGWGKCDLNQKKSW